MSSKLLRDVWNPENPGKWKTSIPEFIMFNSTQSHANVFSTQKGILALSIIIEIVLIGNYE